METRRRRFICREIVPFAAMVAVECTNVGQTTIYKAAVSKGLNYHVFMVYSYAISALALLPMACFFHRGTQLPSLSITMLAKFFVLGCLGFLGEYLGYLGIAYSNPTLGSAMSNLSPACTFFLAVLFRMEKLKLGSLSTQAKIIGALVSISGALVVVLYNGPILITGYNDKAAIPTIYLHVASSAESNWIVGGALLASCYFVSSIWYIYQSVVIREYPGEFILGIIGTGLNIMIRTWSLHVKGPVYVTMFGPLAIAIAAILGVIFLGDDLYLGSVIGSIVITVGFYTVMWGKTKEEIIVIVTSNDNLVESSVSDHVIVPLLKH
ncbi:hypothetical protein CASFOL_026468 [Castilleja foliolosa]|uniref:WAT1-related protein n=1 Tax=Castilleja foliolosa TaxID=1961234 RepID=A0ABD3CJW4_9LAMI